MVGKLGVGHHGGLSTWVRIKMQPLSIAHCVGGSGQATAITIGYGLGLLRDNGKYNGSYYINNGV